ncbi:zygote arrest protein 1-like isoform X2 [Carcharodon carcharias]|uniref:zygote arrest protein 1-like isoform X2 n=1 Tax=Carcharodon carcharias TaxID=13397 RepID=UPI001B7E7383|nr:zygote arrest protein 1-like isoform X2 [Carcharodon carcharias]
MEGFVYSPLNTYTYNNSKSRQQNYSRKSYPPGTVEAVEYLDNYKRAQLKAILSQVNPNLTPRLRKANTKEIGIQVNPKVDASVQCSLGPRTLPRQKRRAASEGAAPSARSLSPGAAADAGGDPEAGGVQPRSPAVVRFSRPVAVYSPVFDRCLVEENQEQGKPEDWESGFPLLERPKAAALLPETGGLDTAQEKEEDREKAEQRDSPETRAGEGSQKFRFQVYFKQFCRKCDNGYNPYRVEAILCQTCFKTRCTCTQKKRHIDPKRPHRQELCGRCRGKRLSCDNTYSFKYIV